MKLETQESLPLPGLVCTLAADAPSPGSTKPARTGRGHTSPFGRGPHPRYIRCGSSRPADGYRFQGWVWQDGRWQEGWVAAEKFEASYKRKLKRNRENRTARQSVYTKYNTSPKGWLASLKSRCQRRGIPFAMTQAWFENNPIPESCPIFPWVKLSGKRGLGANDAQLDRKIPSLGYTEGNIRWVSARANRLKDNATLPELEAICADLKRIFS